MHLDSITPEKSNQWWKKIVFFGLFFFLVGLAFYIFKFYQSYQTMSDLYVDNHYQGWLKLGSEKYPYADLSQALQAATLKKAGLPKIHLRNGEYPGNITLPANMEIYGQSRDGVVFKNPDPLLPTVIMKNNSRLNGLTISGGLVGIAAEEQAAIENCSVTEFKKIGIDARPSEAEIMVKNSEIFNSSGKGLYIQSGRKIQIIGNNIHNNKEEGLDLRQEVSGEIKTNNIYANEESGIELVVGKSALQIAENNIWDNGANGITCQYYADMPEKGSILIRGNYIKALDAEKYTVSVKSPSGGEGRIKNYWRDSVTIAADNVLEGALKTRSLEITKK